MRMEDENKQLHLKNIFESQNRIAYCQIEKIL